MKNGKKYKVVLTNCNGEEIAQDHRSFKSLDGALKRLSALVCTEELCLKAGFGQEHNYHVMAC